MEIMKLSDKTEKKLHHRLFPENAWTIYNNADKILNDTRMFFAPVNIRNGVAYIGDKPFEKPTVGIYLEWWMKYPETSIDRDGNLIWFISGSPLSGANASMSVSPSGMCYKVEETPHLNEIMRSFSTVNHSYDKQKQEIEPYTFEEVLTILRGKEYGNTIKNIQEELNLLSRLYDHREGYDSSRIIKSSQRTTLQRLRKPIMEFFDDYSLVEKGMYKLKEEYEEKLKGLREKYPDEGAEFYIQQSAAIYPYLASLRVLVSMVESFMADTFGRNPNKLDFIDVIRWARREKELEEKRKDRD